ncbi:phosphatase PAP2 family protein [Chitinophaga pendula]|uniref:phosphatase PAP2 family protein n=1 Tax=Chitinophaga TaxID=79328 RepID=UPI000BAF6174|nr:MULTISPECIES: phosphatase PAP2 family protein [Chitinophaga]ASZ12901.1 hypothetical protein CK934_19035 [Chitinophaga sp. MD30]UCJ09470.1 phosphatase PAP2 family protein [Chitinophaga pendula]
MSVQERITFRQRQREVIRQTRVLLIPFLCLLLGVLIIKFLYTKEEIYYYVNGLHFAAGDVFFPLVTELGSTTMALLVIFVLLCVSYRKGFIAATGFVFTAGIGAILKQLFGAPRPKLFFEQALREIYYVKGVTVLSNHLSFPSGHSICAFTSATLLTYLVPRKAWGVLFLLLAMLVGYSRLYMSQHFFEDVAMGASLGVFLTLFWVGWLDVQPFLQRPSWQRGLLKR